MQWYTNDELADMHLVYGIDEDNRTAAQTDINYTTVHLHMCIRICGIRFHSEEAGVVRIGPD